MKLPFINKVFVFTCFMVLFVGAAIYVRQHANPTLKVVDNQAFTTTNATKKAEQLPIDASVIAAEGCQSTLTTVTEIHSSIPTIPKTTLAMVESSHWNEEAEEAKERKTAEGRWEAEFQKIKDPKTGKIPRNVHQKGVDAAKKVRELQLPAELSGDGLSQRALPTITVTPRGPNNYGGRTRAIAFDKLNTQNVLAGGVSGGLFRSTNGGSSWTRITPSGEIHSVTAIAQDPRANQEATWYFGTGESGSSAKAEGADYLGHGIWKSTNNGLTWSVLTSTRNNQYAFDVDFDYISRIVVDPNNGNVLVAASETVKRSTDGGSTWANVLGTGANGAPTDLIYNSVSVGGSTYFYAAINGANANGGIYRSADGATWTQIRTPAQLQANGVKRITLANVANTSNILAFYEHTTPIACTGGGTTQAGLQLFDAGAGTWTDHSQKISTCASGGSNPKVISFQSGYNMCIATKPDDANTVYLGGVEIYRVNLNTGAYDYIGGDQGSANATNLHVDNHLLVFEPGSNTTLWAGNDGGMRKTDVTGAIAAGPTGGYTWSDRNSGYVTYQYYRADINPTTGSTFLAGSAQDNAITLQPTDATAKEIHGGDGTCIGVISGTDFNTYNVLVATQEGAISRIANGTTTDIKPAGQAQGFETYFLLDADNTNYLYYPTNAKKLYRTRNATAIAATTITNVTTDWEAMTGIVATLTGNITTMAVTRNGNGAAYTASDANRKMYIGTDDGKVYRLADPAFAAVATTPTLITPTGATGYVSDVAIHPYNDKEVMVTYSNYGVASVWHTADASVATPTWVNVEGAAGSAVELASARSAMIVRAGSSNLYIVGTSTGLYGTTTLSGATTVWERIGSTEIGLAPSVAMRLRTADNQLVLGTHGNGLFQLAFPASVLPLTLLSFTGAKELNAVQLNWVSVDEKAFSHYNVEKSEDGKTFRLLTTLKGSNSGNYSTKDEKPFAGVNYYRLEMVDLNGKKEYSRIISVEFGEESMVMTVYPNPSVENRVSLHIHLNEATDLQFEWKDIAGRTRLTHQQTCTQGSNQIPIEIASLEKGIYFISVRNANHPTPLRVLRFVKQ